MEQYRVMLVDNDPTTLAISRALLEKTYNLMLAQSGLQALGLLQNQDCPDLVVIDTAIPGMDGMTLLERIREIDEMKETPVIFMVDAGQAVEEAKCYAKGVVGFARKPINPTALKLQIQRQTEYLSLKKENAQLKRVLRMMHDQFDLIFPEGV